MDSKLSPIKSLEELDFDGLANGRNALVDKVNELVRRVNEIASAGDILDEFPKPYRDDMIIIFSPNDRYNPEWREELGECMKRAQEGVWQGKKFHVIPSIYPMIVDGHYYGWDHEIVVRDGMVYVEKKKGRG